MQDKLTEEHMKELNKFLIFFRTKKDDTLKEIDLDYRDYISDNLTDDMAIYNKEDVNKISF